MLIYKKYCELVDEIVNYIDIDNIFFSFVSGFYT